MIYNEFIFAVFILCLAWSALADKPAMFGWLLVLGTVATSLLIIF